MKRMFEKIGAFLLITTLILGVSLPQVSAATTPVKISISDVTVERGKEFEITVRLDDVPSFGMGAVSFAIEYDSGYINITETSITEGPISKTGALEREKALQPGVDLPDIFLTNVTDGIIRFDWVTGLTPDDNVYYIRDSGVFCTIKGTLHINTPASVKALDFKIVSPTKNSEIVFGYFDDNGDDVIDENDPFIGYSFTKQDGKLTVAGTAATTNEKPANWPDMLGDIDGNSNINVTDIIVMLRFLGGVIGPNSPPDENGKPTWHAGMYECSDVFRENNLPTYNPRVDAQDLAILVKKVLKDIDTLPQYAK